MIDSFSIIKMGRSIEIIEVFSAYNGLTHMHDLSERSMIPILNFSEGQYLSLLIHLELSGNQTLLKFELVTVYK